MISAEEGGEGGIYVDEQWGVDAPLGFDVE